MPLYEIEGLRPTLPDDASAWIAPSADVIGDAVLGRNVGIWFGAVIRADNTQISIGDGTNVQDGALLHSDVGSPLIIGNDCTIGHQAILHGCELGNRVLVGMGARILNNAKIGDDCLVGAGALVTEGKTFPPRSLIVGVPAKVVKELSADMIADLKTSAVDYACKQGRYHDSLRLLEDT